MRSLRCERGVARAGPAEVAHRGGGEKNTHNDLLLLSGDLSNDESLVLGSEEDLVLMQAKEGLGGVLSGDLCVEEDCLTSGMAVVQADGMSVEWSPEGFFFSSVDALTVLRTWTSCRRVSR